MKGDVSEGLMGGGYFRLPVSGLWSADQEDANITLSKHFERNVKRGTVEEEHRLICQRCIIPRGVLEIVVGVYISFQHSSHLELLDFRWQMMT